jgi:dipeptidyl aminopeptidase/acylaminoacyl peptidase
VGVAAMVVWSGAAAQQPRREVIRSQLVWFDRTGKRLGTVGNLDDFGNVELSPDGKTAAVTLLDSQLGTHDLWLYDVASGSRTRFTSDPDDENWLIWSADGRRVIFNSFGRERLELLQTVAVAGAARDTLLADVEGLWPVSWSRDGKFLLFVRNSQKTGNDVWVLPLSGAKKARAVLDTDAAENWAAFSPDGHWIAYSSNESGVAEVYVMPFPATGRKWLVSRGGGFQARWRRDGRELFYLSANRMLMAAAVKAEGGNFQIDTAQRLFEVHLPYAPYHAFDVAADGQRFLVSTLVVGPGAPARVASHSPPEGGRYDRTPTWPTAIK